MGRNCGLGLQSVSRRKLVETPCTVDHHLKKDDFELVGALALVFLEIVLKCQFLPKVVGRIFCGQVTHSQEQVEQSLRPETGKVDQLHSLYEGLSTLLPRW